MCEKNIFYVRKNNSNTHSNKGHNNEIDHSKPIPDFIKLPVKETKEFLALTPSNSNEQENQTTKIENTLLGVALHKVLEMFVHKDKVDPEMLKQYIKNNVSPQKQHADALENLINNIINPQIQNAQIKKEVKIHKKISDTLEISAKIDLLIIKEKEVQIVDYKTTMSETIPEAVYQQLALYYYLVSSIYPHKKISCKIIAILTCKEINVCNEKIENTLTSRIFNFCSRKLFYPASF